MSRSVEAALLNARRHARRGEVEAARALYQGILDRFPSNKRARQGLKALEASPVQPAAPRGPAVPRDRLEALMGLCESGRHDDALRLGQELARAYPGSVAVQNLLGAANSGLDRVEDALVCYRQAVRMGPGQSAGHNNLGVALAGLGRLEEAERSYRRAIELDPANADAWSNLGHGLHRLGRVEDALEAFREALRLDPGHGDALSNMGALLIEQQRFEEAVLAGEDALNSAPGLPEARILLGDALREMQRPAQALDHYAEAARLQPGQARIQGKLGQVLVDLGRVDEAREAFGRALEAEPGDAATLYALSAITTFREGMAEIDRMEALARDPQAGDADLRYLHFALAKACRDTGKVEQSFHHLVAGNRARKRLSGYDIATDRALFAAIRKSFSETPFVPGEPPADAGPRPVFVLGMPRSGTTLTEQILASHSRVFGAGELPDLQLAIDASGWRPGAPPTGDQLAAVRERYMGSIAAQAQAQGRDVVVDKMPLNFRHVGMILGAMPEARIVHLCRDARATCWSIFTQNFGNFGNGFADDLGDVVEYYKMYRDLMAFWHDRFPGRVHDQSYEALTEDQEPQTRRLLDHVGLDWEEQCLSFHELDRGVRTASRLQVRKKMYKGSSEAWREYEPFLADFVAGLGGF